MTDVAPPRRFCHPVNIARQFLFVREAQQQGQNRGLWVEGIQHIAGGSQGDSWCMEFVWMVLAICYQGTPPIPRMQSCEDLHQSAIAHGWIVPTPLPGDLFLYVDDTGRAHHVGFVTIVTPAPLSNVPGDIRVAGIAGNTSADGTSVNGDRVAEHTITAHVFVRLPMAA